LKTVRCERCEGPQDKNEKRRVRVKRWIIRRRKMKGREEEKEMRIEEEKIGRRRGSGETQKKWRQSDAARVTVIIR